VTSDKKKRVEGRKNPNAKPKRIIITKAPFDSAQGRRKLENTKKELFFY